MRLGQDNHGNIIKEAETAEDYLLLEIERLKEENEILRKELKEMQENKTIKFNIYGFVDEEYKVKTKYGMIRIEHLEKKERGKKNE